jgi:dCMP deaminase
LRKCICAERKLISHAARDGIKIGGSTMYVTKKPCLECAKSIIDAGIERVVYKDDYTDTITSEMFDEAGIDFVQLK